MKNIWKDGVMGVVIGDALGCPVQFERQRYGWRYRRRVGRSLLWIWCNPERLASCYPAERMDRINVRQPRNKWIMKQPPHACVRRLHFVSD